jgi:hypothetical protein
LRHAMGSGKLLLHASAGAYTDVKCLGADDPEVPQTGKPLQTFPYGTTKFNITGLAPGATVTVTLVFPDDVPTNSTYYKICAKNGWQEIPFGDNDGDDTSTLTLTDGDALTDTDGRADGTIQDPGALATTSSGVATVSSSGGGDGGGGIVTAAGSESMSVPWALLLIFGIAGIAVSAGRK